MPAGRWTTERPNAEADGLLAAIFVELSTVAEDHTFMAAHADVPMGVDPLVVADPWAARRLKTRTRA